MPIHKSSQFEILKGLPPYGPMYISINTDGEDFFSEGFVIRFYSNDGANWVANFKPGWTSCYEVFDYPKFKLVIVLVGGCVYVMSPENKNPIASFGLAIEQVLTHNNENLIFSDSTQIFYYNISENSLWCSERISLDGIKDLKIYENILLGKNYDISENEEWEDFSINLDTKEITGGSFRKFLKNNPTTEGKDKSWWKFW